MSRCWRSAVLAVCMGAMSLAEVSAQVAFIDAGLNQSYTSSDALGSPLGFSVVVGGLGLLGPLGLEVSYRDLSEGAGQIAQTCEMLECTLGPFDRSFSLRTIGVGISYDIENPTDVMLTLGLHGATNRQTEHLRNVETGARTDAGESDSDYSVGFSADLRLRPVMARLRPAFTVRYDRVSQGSCPAGASCFRGRDVVSISAGVSWVQRAKR